MHGAVGAAVQVAPMQAAAVASVGAVVVGNVAHGVSCAARVMQARHAGCISLQRYAVNPGQTPPSWVIPAATASSCGGNESRWACVWCKSGTQQAARVELACRTSCIGLQGIAVSPWSSPAQLGHLCSQFGWGELVG